MSEAKWRLGRCCTGWSLALGLAALGLGPTAPARGGVFDDAVAHWKLNPDLLT